MRVQDLQRVAFAYEWDWITRAETASSEWLEQTVSAQMNRSWPATPCETKQALLADAFEVWQAYNPSARSVRLQNASGRTLGVHAYYCEGL